jgi:hypothetical protein
MIDGGARAFSEKRCATFDRPGAAKPAGQRQGDRGQKRADGQHVSHAGRELAGDFQR